MQTIIQYATHKLAGKPTLLLTIDHSAAQELKVQLQMPFTTVVQMSNQGTFRQRGVSVGGLFFVSFWRSKKKRKKTNIYQN